MSASKSVTSRAIVPYKPCQSSEEFLISNLEKGVSQAYERALELAKVENILLKTYGKAPLILLAGTSSAGKSSVIHSLILQDPKYQEDGCDMACVSFDVELVKEKAPDLYQRMAKAMEDGYIALAIFTDVPKVFKKGISKKIRLDAIKAIEQTKKLALKSVSFSLQDLEIKLYSAAIKSSIKGQSVIFDIVVPQSFPEYVFRQNVQAPIKIVLVYCPFEHILSRVLNRNRLAKETGDIKEMRLPYLPLIQFADVYCRANPGDTVLEVITREQVNKLFEMARQEEILMASEVAKSPGELNRVINYEINPTYGQDKSEFLEIFGFSDSVHSVAITPRFKRYNYLLNTQIMEPKDSVEVLLS